MADKSFFIDTTKCTACRGCQIACKQWNMNPATKTVQRGSHQNPEDLSYSTYKLVRFSEFESEGKPIWYFFADQCRHCTTPPCKIVAESTAFNSLKAMQAEQNVHLKLIEWTDIDQAIHALYNWPQNLDHVLT